MWRCSESRAGWSKENVFLVFNIHQVLGQTAHSFLYEMPLVFVFTCMAEERFLNSLMNQESFFAEMGKQCRLIGKYDCLPHYFALPVASASKQANTWSSCASSASFCSSSTATFRKGAPFFLPFSQYTVMLIHCLNSLFRVSDWK